MEERNLPKADFVASLILIGFGVWIVIHSLNMPRFTEFGANPFSVPGIVPGILGTIISLLSLLVFIRSIRRRGYRLGLSRSSLKRFFQDASSKRMLITCLVCIIYGLVLIGHIQYFTATFIYVFVFLIIFQYRFSEAFRIQWKLVLFSTIQALLIAGAVAVVFRYLFLVDLP